MINLVWQSQSRTIRKEIQISFGNKDDGSAGLGGLYDSWYIFRCGSRSWIMGKSAGSVRFTVKQLICYIYCMIKMI